MRVVLDTNIVVSGFLWKGAPRRLLDAAREERVALCVSSVLLAELAEVLSREHLACALAAQVDLVVSGDSHLLNLKREVVPRNRTAG